MDRLLIGGLHAITWRCGKAVKSVGRRLSTGVWGVSIHTFKLNSQHDPVQKVSMQSGSSKSQCFPPARLLLNVLLLHHWRSMMLVKHGLCDASAPWCLFVFMHVNTHKCVCRFEDVDCWPDSDPRCAPVVGGRVDVLQEESSKGFETQRWGNRTHTHTVTFSRVLHSLIIWSSHRSLDKNQDPFLIPNSLLSCVPEPPTPSAYASFPEVSWRTSEICLFVTRAVDKTHLSSSLLDPAGVRRHQTRGQTERSSSGSL